MNQVTFFIDGEPVAKQSFRYSRNGGGYTPERVKVWEQIVSLGARLNVKERFSGRVKVNLAFTLSTNRKVDLDNLSKGVLDGLKNIAFGDDSNVTELLITKTVDKKKPGVQVTIEGAK